MKRPAVFFDRDNTLIANAGYLGDPRRVTLLAGAADAVAAVRTLGYAIVIFSNQSGVARGYFTEDAVHAVNKRIEKLLRLSNNRAVIDRHEFCPDHPTAVVLRYRRDGNRRKPNPGMILDAADALALDLSASWVIGDAPRDIAAGKAAGCRTIWFRDPTAKPSPDSAGNAEPDFVVATLEEAANIIRTHPHPSATLAERTPEEDLEPIEDDEPEPQPPQDTQSVEESPPPVEQLAEPAVEPVAEELFVEDTQIAEQDATDNDLRSANEAELDPSDEFPLGELPLVAQMNWAESTEPTESAVTVVAEPPQETVPSIVPLDKTDHPPVTLEQIAQEPPESLSVSDAFAYKTHLNDFEPFSPAPAIEDESPAPQPVAPEPSEPPDAPAPSATTLSLESDDDAEAPLDPVEQSFSGPAPIHAPAPAPMPMPEPEPSPKSDPSRFDQDNFDASIERLRKLSEQVMKQDLSRMENLTEQVLIELKQFRSDRASAADFSVSKLLAGISIVLSITMAFLAFVNRSDPLQAEAVFRWAIFLLILTVALLIMGRDT
jgi:D,D-heptose 1,7-bisphosphate phosphatase